ncbi:ATP-binding protein [Arthrobacter sp. M4]|uniref:ATP-binding protein n=1 Tax=Arthrobacter sp. M4 TaxID=218160 RepID=UPI001CDBCD04|nr:ATP-binding protein [Arthrobacter sp. M4]MCA4134739.1 ATP-binding protein [Arthrobacter sp. M4]
MTEILAERSFRGLATPEAIESVHNHLDAIWADAAFVPDTDQMIFTTAVIETAANVVQHGRPIGDEPVELGVELTVSATRLQAKVSAFHAIEPIVPYDDAELPDEDSESGRGLALIKALVTTLIFERQDETNTWILSKDSRPES